MPKIFQKSIYFEKLVLIKRSQTDWDYMHENICLVLDGVEKLCSSDGDGGQSLSVPGTRNMVWNMPTHGVTEIKLNFKKSSTIVANGRHASVASDLKIHYSSS